MYPSLQSPEFTAAFDELIGDVAELSRTFDELGIHANAKLDDETAALERALDGMNAVYEKLARIRSYLYAFVSTNSRDDVAQGKMSELGVKTVVLGQLSTRFEAWIGGLDLERVLAQSEAARDHAYMLRRAAVRAKHQMTPQEEELASLLNLSGGSAWAKLHSNVTSQLKVDVHGQALPMSAVRNLAADADAKTREDAYRAELGAWQTVEVTLAAAMNGIKGQANVLGQRRGYADPIEPTLTANSIDRETLEAMQAACVDAFPAFRRYFRAKAKLLGRDRLPWWDLFAPVGKTSKAWSYDEAKAFIVEQFGTYSDKLANFADRAFQEDWLDVAPREGKVGGAFCMGWQNGESRILLNYRPDLDSVSTLAHELGHGYHNLCLKDRRPLQKGTPMTLAETASIFCETIAVNAALSAASGDEKLYILETQLQGHAQVVVDIHSRFLFEKRVFEARKARDLSPAELCAFMVEAQEATYGDAISDPHPYMWAVKSHYYGSSFYNYPYTFGLLFGLGLYAVYQRDPEAFKAGYDDLLASTGLADAATLAGRFGIDTRSKAFWQGSLSVIEASIDEYEKMVHSVVTA